MTASSTPENATPRRRRGTLRGLSLAGGLAVCVLVGSNSLRSETKSADVPFDGEQAFGYLVKICRLGSRTSGSSGMADQLKLVSEHFQKLGAEVKFQSFDAPHPLTGVPVRMHNILVSWHPTARERVLLACHYDTRPYPDNDRDNPRGLFVGANDGASGVALFMELGNHMAKLKPTLGVDFVLFDGEELVFNRTGKYFLGSEHFAKQYRDHPPAHTYRYGVVIDMIADKNLRIAQEKNSVKLAPEPTASLWAAAKTLGIREFVPKVEYEVQDDHLPLNDVAKIPTCDVIDFDYPYWHTAQDVPQNCDGKSLTKVARVLAYWMQNVPETRRRR